ncbi:MAG: DUF1559 domain-containing protein [Planctomycetaceae bacterium]|jgi:hypothetical protein|nr:DUF1559 domain-containing protein [Planctomycetaceae bacterium]
MSRYSKIYFVLLSAITLCCYGQCYAQKTPKQLAEEIAPLVSENTICIVHVDVAASLKDVFNVYNANIQTFRDAVASVADMDESVKSAIAEYTLPKISEQEMQIANKQFQELRKTFGVQDFYYLATLDGVPISDFIAIPVRPETNKELLEQQKFTELNGFMIIYGKAFRNTLQRGTSQEFVRRAFQNGFVKSQRPEIAEAFAIAGNKPIKAVAFFPSYANTLFSQIKPTLHKPLNMIPVAQITDGLRYAAAAFDFNTFRGEFVICSKDQASAEQLRNLVLSLSDTTKELQKNGVDKWDDLIVFSRWSDFIGGLVKQNSDFLFPPAQDGKIVIRYQSTDSAADVKKLLNSVNALAKQVKMDEIFHQKTCGNNIKQIVLAMHNYSDVHLKLTPAYSLDKDGKPLQSWRVSLLPYLGETALYEKIRRDEAWDSEWNKQFHNQCPAIFQCPTMTDEEKTNGGTSYSLVVGNKTYPTPGKRHFSLSDITDGTSYTIAVIERKTPINWMQPDAELSQDAVFHGISDAASGVGLRHQKEDNAGLNAGFFDGSQRFLDEKTPLEKWKAFLTFSGGEWILDR